MSYVVFHIRTCYNEVQGVVASSSSTTVRHIVVLSKGECGLKFCNFRTLHSLPLFTSMIHATCEFGLLVQNCHLRPHSCRVSRSYSVAVYISRILGLFKYFIYLSKFGAAQSHRLEMLYDLFLQLAKSHQVERRCS